MARKTDPTASKADPKGPVLIEETAQDTPETAVEQATAATPSHEADIPDTGPDTGTDSGPDSTTDTPEPDSVVAVSAPGIDGPARPADETMAPDPERGIEDAVLSDTIPEPDLPEPARSEPDAPAKPAPAPQVTVQKVGFLPLVAGGAIAAALGFGAAWVYLGQQTTGLADQIAAQTARITDLEQRLATVPTDLSPLEAGIAEADEAIAGLTTRVDEIGTEMTAGISAEVAALEERLVAVERAPGVDGTLAATAIASWEQELDTLRADIAAQQDRMSTIATTAQADLDAARAEAEQVEQDAAAAAQDAVARAALARVQAALDQGMAYDAALGDLTGAGAEVPPELSSFAADGVPTIVALTETFPDAARAALAAARSAGEADVDSNPITAFLRNQFDVRSVDPREGTDPDAVLSRAGAALGDNRLTDALAEIATLPEVARAEMSDWTAQAEARAAAIAAVETLAQSMNN